MYCMWSTSNPSDEIEDTRQIVDIEEAFDISIDQESCYLFYDMNLDEAAIKISKMIKQKC